MNTDDLSKLVEFADSLVSEKTGQHLETVEKEILRQTLKGKKLSAIEFPSYENSYVQRYLAPQLWKLLSYVAGEKVGKKTVLEVLQRLQSQRFESEAATQNQSRTDAQTELNGDAAFNGSVSCLEKNGAIASSEPDESTPSQERVSNGIHSNGTNGQNPNHLNSQAHYTPLPTNGQQREPSQTEPPENTTGEDCSSQSTAEEFQLSSQICQTENSDETRSSTNGSFMNFLKPGVPLLLSLGVLGGLFALSWLANWYGVTHHLARQLPKAQFGYSLALKLNPLSMAARYNQAAIYEDQHNYDRAHAEYQLAIAGGLIEAYNNEARLYILQGNYDAAVSLLQIGLPLAQDDRVKYTMLKNQGWARLEQGRYAEAKVNLTEALKLKSTSRASAHCLLAQVLERERNEKAALVEWENCLAFAYQPDTPEEDNWIHLARQRLDNEGGEK